MQIFLYPAIAVFFLSFAWYVHPVFIFFGFVPLLVIQYHYINCDIKHASFKFWFLIYAVFLFWNIIVTWWIVNSTIGGAIMAFTLNSLFMTIPFMLSFHMARFLKKHQYLPTYQPVVNSFLFIVLWVAYEYMHHRWDLSWPWLTLGNVMAWAHQLVQWYEYTGTLGGTAWILIVNLLLCLYMLKKSKTLLVYIGLAFIVPAFISILIYYNVEDEGQKTGAVVVQPNIDPYTEKFYGSPQFIPYIEQTKRLIALSVSKIDSNTSVVAWPETSLSGGYDEDIVGTLPITDTLWKMCKKNNKTVLISGTDTYKIYRTEFDKTPTSKYIEGIGWYDYFNTAILAEPYKKIQFYHKCKLVPGVEQMPFLQAFPLLENFAINLGGITGSLGKTNEKNIFVSKSGNYIPSICYESIYGELCAMGTKAGGQAIVIITNDAWWGNTPGHKQHFEYAKLRAIEVRKSIARAANTGLSGFINQRGDVVQKSLYNEKIALKNDIYLNNRQTFYATYGDFLGLIAKYIAIFVTTVFFMALIIHKIWTLKKSPVRL